MTSEARDELLGRLDLMEQMVRNGRRTTSYYGWMFVLWGVGYMVAVGWIYFLPHTMLAWPVTMTATAIVGAAMGSIKSKGQPETVKSRALGGIWAATGWSIFLFAFGGAFGHSWDHPQLMMAGIENLIGLANAASSFALKWKAQFAVALLWWSCSLVSLYATPAMLLPILVVGTFFGNFVFGIYLMVLEARAKKAAVGHAGA